MLTSDPCLGCLCFVCLIMCARTLMCEWHSPVWQCHILFYDTLYHISLPLRFSTLTLTQPKWFWTESHSLCWPALFGSALKPGGMALPFALSSMDVRLQVCVYLHVRVCVTSAAKSQILMVHFVFLSESTYPSVILHVLVFCWTEQPNVLWLFFKCNLRSSGWYWDLFLSSFVS